MFLKKIEMQGFKSFADKIVLEVNNGITAVVGPNGSGKSNISDAVRWVLGEQSMKSLRGSKSEDIIFAGTEKRKSLGFAEVSITFDNINGQLPVEFSEVTATRRIYRSGESEFFINKAPCRLKDINELFMGTGVGRDGYSVIGQGRIDEILSTKADDRRQIFEEAAGIMKYKTRKIEAERKIDQTKQNLLRINDIVGELESQLDPLHEQSKTAKKFLNLKERLKILEVNLFINNMERFKEKFEEVQTKIQRIQTQILDEQNSFDENQKQKKLIQAELEVIEQDIENFQQNVFDLEKNMEQCNSDIKLENERLENLDKNDNRLEEEIMQFKEKINQFKIEDEQKKTKIEVLNKDREKFVQELTSKEKELSEVNKSISTDQEAVEAIKTEVIEKINENSDKKSQLNSLKAFLEGIARREDQIDEELRDLVLSKDMQTIKKEEINNQKESLLADIKQIRDIISSIDGERRGLEAELTSVDKEIESTRLELGNKQSRHKFLTDMVKDNEGYFKSVKEILDRCSRDNSFKQGIHGALAQLINVPKKYETCIEIALGSALQNIVTDDEQSAKKAIEYLKQKNLGRATFLPLNVVKGNCIDEQVMKIDTCQGFMGVAAKLIECSAAYKGIVNNMLGHTVVVDNMDNGINIARKFKYSFRIVTLEGDLINTSGAMTGGSVNTRATGLLSRGREIKELSEILEKLKIKLQEKVNKLAETKEAISKKLDEMNLKNAETKEKQVAVAREEEKFKAANDLIENIKGKIVILNTEKEQIKVQRDDAESSIADKQKSITETENTIEQLQVKVKEAQEKFKQIYAEKDRVFEYISDIKVSLSSIDESISGVQADIQRINTERESLAKDIIKRQEEIKRKGLEKDSLKGSVEKHKEQIITLEERKKEFEQKLSESKLRKDEINSKYSAMEDEVLQKIKIMDSLKEENTACEMKKSKLEMDMDALQNRMWDEYEITLNNSLKYKSELGAISNVQREINQLKNEIRSLGVVNVSAIEEYEKMKERFEFLTTQRDDLLESESKLKKVINEMTSIMKRQFLEQFNKICVNFNEVFIALFGGGKATLKLSDEENILESGIDIEVQPPGKKLQNMMLMSGGEKALTAIALLFAILKINPSPFCILDEIEAALDEANVYVFTDYVKKFTFNTQFIIITHRKATMESANTMYGVTMEERGVSKLISLKMSEKVS